MRAATATVAVLALGTLKQCGAAGKPVRTTPSPTPAVSTVAPVTPVDAIDAKTASLGVADTRRSQVDGRQLKLKWSDEFEGTTLNTNKWIVMEGDGCDIYNCNWGNNEKQTYRETNVRVNGGNLVLEAEMGTFNATAFNTTRSYKYASGKIHSKGADSGFYNLKYGRIEMGVQLPYFNGGWPAGWMMPATYPKEGVYGTWPRSGELDVVEHINKNSWSAQTMHYYDPKRRGPAQQGSQYPTGISEDSLYHTFALERTSTGVIDFYVDGVRTVSPSGWPQPTRGLSSIAPFDQPFSVILNLAILGNWASGNLGSNAEALTAQAFANGAIKHQFKVDYVRVWEEVPLRRQLEATADTDATKQQQQQQRRLARSCGNSTPYGRSPITKSPVPWDFAPGRTLSLGAPYYDTGACGFKKAKPGNRGNAPGLRGADGLDVSMNPDTLATSFPYVSELSKGSNAVWTVDFGGAGRVVDIRAVVSGSAAGALTLLLDSDDCNGNVQSVTARGGTILVGETALPASDELQYHGSDVAVPAGVHAITVCAAAGSFNLHSLEFADSAGPASVPGAPASRSGPQPIPPCFSGSCREPPSV